MATIAGHTFKEGPGGRACEYCGKRWADISYARKEDIGQPGWAHSGNLAEGEFNQIVTERERVWDLAMGFTRRVKETPTSNTGEYYCG